MTNKTNLEELEKQSVQPEALSAMAEPELAEIPSAAVSSEAGTEMPESAAPAFDTPVSVNPADESVAEDLAEPNSAPQTDAEPEKKPKRRKKTVAKTDETDPVQSETDGTEQEAADKIPAGAEDREESENVAAPTKKTKKRTLAKSTQVLSIDDRRTVETEEDKAKNDLLDLLESLKTGRILTGTIQGVERASDNQSMAVIYHGAYKIVIPAEEAVNPPDDFRDQSPADVFHYLLTKRLGAEVDFIVKGVDAEASVAVASRLDAMKSKRKQYYFGVDRDGNNLLYSGQCAEARVVSVIRAGIFVELFGLELYIPLRELSYQRLMDASGYFRPGQRILVKILDIDRTDRNHIKVSASVKQAGENPYAKALKRYVVDNRYVGTVSMVDTNGVFVALDGGIDCLCSYPKRGRPPRGARVTVRILGINYETNRIWGAITHIAMPR